MEQARDLKVVVETSGWRNVVAPFFGRFDFAQNIFGSERNESFGTKPSIEEHFSLKMKSVASTIKVLCS
jgi:hypothetical protein